jgi:uncharacterized membrane protein (DUF2068 family)
MTEHEPPTGSTPGRGLRYELIGCALHGHRLVGVGAAELRELDAPLARESRGLRWHRCLRCDAWIPLPPPRQPTAATLPEPGDIELPARGKVLRDRYVLRLIALDRLAHFLLLGALAIGVFVFARKRTELSGLFYRILDAAQNGVGGASGTAGRGLVGELSKAFQARSSTLVLIGLALAAYAVLEGVEAVGLWLARRWAEYLTFVATAVLLIPEVYELVDKVSTTKIITLIINLAVVAYLLVAKRLFGLRGGGRVEEELRARDSGWPALARVLPGGAPGSPVS